MTYRQGHLINNRFEVEGILGEGAQGIVYSATDITLGSRVAVKCLQEDVAVEPGFKTRMVREARIMGTLSGTSAVQVLDVGKTSDGSMYIAMEYVDGVDFEVYLKNIEANDRKLSIAKLCELMTPIVATLDLAHSQGIVHRDLKPSNIMVLKGSGRGPVRLMDFGLAKDLKADPLTLEGTVAGSPLYIAPEGWQGKPDALDHRIDVYSLGAVIFRALTGIPPFGPSRPLHKLMVNVTQGPRPSLYAHRSELPIGIDTWLHKALASNPGDRFQSVSELWSEFMRRCK